MRAHVTLGVAFFATACSGAKPQFASCFSLDAGHLQSLAAGCAGIETTLIAGNTCDFPVTVSRITSNDTHVSVKQPLPLTIPANQQRPVSFTASSADGGATPASLNIEFNDSTTTRIPVSIDAPPREHFHRGFWLNPAVDVLIARSSEFSPQEVSTKLSYGLSWLSGSPFYRFHFVSDDLGLVEATDANFADTFDAGVQSLQAVPNPLETIRARLTDIPLQQFSFVTVFAFSDGTEEATTPLSALFSQLATGRPAPPDLVLFVRDSTCPAATSTWLSTAENAQPPEVRLLDVCQSNYDTEMLGVRVNDWPRTTRLYFDGWEFRPSLSISYDGAITTEWDIGHSAPGDYYELRPGSFESHRQFTVDYDLLSACERGETP